MSNHATPNEGVNTPPCDAPCCTACGGRGANLDGPCWDCRGTGHAHPWRAEDVRRASERAWDEGWAARAQSRPGRYSLDHIDGNPYRISATDAMRRVAEMITDPVRWAQIERVVRALRADEDGAS